MSVLDAIMMRRSIRVFRSDDVSEELVMRLVDAACRAPSAGNLQPWEFVIVRKPEIKRRLVDAAFGQSFVGEVPVVIVVCADENRSFEGYGLRGKELYCIQDTAASIQNLNLTACSLGLGTCWVGAFDEEDVKDALNTPEGVRPVAIIPVGYPGELPKPRKRRSVAQVIHHETY